MRELRDRRVARIVGELKALPGKDLFQYVADDGSVVNVRRRYINAYIKEVMGGRFSAKDFRTWAGTMICASQPADAHPADEGAGEGVHRPLISVVGIPRFCVAFPGCGFG